MAIGLTSTLTTYLNQWLKVASKENVVLSRYVTGGLQNFIVFKCKCGENWNVGENLFYSVADPTFNYGIPSELQDWVKEHRHVCKKYKNSFPGAVHSDCDTCKWPYGAHEESWQEPKPKIVPPLPEVRGRKFRD